jgi:exodeoxyribonuclease VII large subunit
MRILQVSDFVEVVNGILRETLSGEQFAVEGEVSGFRVSQGQWVSFDLKDDKSLVNVFMTVWQLNVPVEDGMRVRVFGLPRVYPKYGKFSLSAERVELAGEGALRKALAMLRVRLEKEGIFEPSRKRALPKFPSRIALIASRESAAYGDFIRVLAERWGGMEIDLYHVLVQGERAPQDIVRAIEQAQEGKYEVLVLTRGGGSLEELMSFNDERVVRAIYASKIPTLVAIGHERDITLAEEAADVRGSTPTDCARRLVPDRRDVLYELSNVEQSVESAFLMRMDKISALIERSLSAPGAWLVGRSADLDLLATRCSSGVRQWLGGLSERLTAQTRLMESFDPNRVLARGYALVRDASGKAIVSVRDLPDGERVTLRLADGETGARIEKKTNQKNLQLGLPLTKGELRG